jgi:hypothetical protein
MCGPAVGAAARRFSLNDPGAQTPLGRIVWSAGRSCATIQGRTLAPALNARLTLVNLSAIANKPLFEPLRVLLERCGATAAINADVLNVLLSELGIRAVSAGGGPIRFTAEPPDAGGYEQAAFDTGAVHTRAENWHDFFNGLVWLRFPLTKSALNARHLLGLARQREAGSSARGALRDAATQFDEDGIVVLSADPQLTQLLRCHEWKSVFWERRADLRRGARFVVFGHALYDKLRQPFRGLCGKAVFLDADAALLELPLDTQLAEIDARLAERWRNEAWYSRPADLSTLPLLGIPGVTPDNADPAYYDDRWQFRPLRPGAASGLEPIMTGS